MRRFFFFFIFSSLLILSGNAQASTAMCDIDLSPDKESSIFSGINISSGKISCDGHTSLIHVATIDLTRQGIAFTASPLEKNLGKTLKQQLPSEFLLATGYQIAINANLFTGCCSDSTGNTSTQLRGLAISHGQQIAPAYNDPCPKAKGFPFDTSLVIKSGHVTIVKYPKGNQPAPPTGDTVVTGSHSLVIGGAITPIPQPTSVSCPTSDDFFGPNARTGVGLSSDNSKLYLVAVDGAAVAAPYGSYGITLEQEAYLFDQKLGASNALNLDGGGSTVMVEAMVGITSFLSIPSDKASSTKCTITLVSVDPPTCERYVGMSLAIRVRQ